MKLMFRKRKGTNFNIMFKQVKHSYPFCWRSETPLIYRAVPSWFIRVEHMTKELLKASSDTYWVPDFVKDKRFGNWLRDARDWAVSRNRYWGTPMPIWISPSGDEVRCIGSIAELEELTGQKITDIHRESIDHLEIPSRYPGKPPLKRVPEVFDCWFESGSMPYAQQHYPFGNVKDFEDCFPADFIAEGIDQTRGWFYTLLVISTALFGKAPFKNLIANGLVLASDGQKMSKSKKNYPDPMEVVHKYGADALRLYLINSPVVRAENLRFKEEGVRDIIKDVFLPWFNAFRFLMQNLESYVQEYKQNFQYTEDVKSSNIMDSWILSFTQSLLEYVRKEMELYHLYTVVPQLTKYIDYLTNWYVRMNRKRLKGEGGQEDCKQALLTLFTVLFDIVRMMAPFAPFLAETMFQYLKQISDTKADSVHYLMLPQPNNLLINKNIERAVARMQSVIELGRVIRDRKTIPIKYPLPEVIIVHQDSLYIKDIESLKEYVLSELNVRDIQLTTDKKKYGISLRAEPDHKVLGVRLKQDFKAVTLAIKALSDAEINGMIKNGHKEIAGHKVDVSEIRIIFNADAITSEKYEVHSDNDVVVLLNVTPDSSMQDEGTAREIINRVQKLRKKAHLVPTDEIKIFYVATGDIERVAKEFTLFIEDTVKASFIPSSKRTTKDQLIMEEKQKLKDCELHIILTRESNVETPVVDWINVDVLDLKTHYCNNSKKGLVLLNAAGQKMTLEKLRKEIISLFGISANFYLLSSKGLIKNDNELLKMSSQTVFVCSEERLPTNVTTAPSPYCKIKNFTTNSVCGTIILENPQGIPSGALENEKNLINLWLKKV